MTQGPVKLSRRVAVLVASCAVAGGALVGTSPALAAPPVDDPSEASAVPSAEPSAEVSAEPSAEASTEPSADPSAAPSTEASAEPSAEASTAPPPAAMNPRSGSAVFAKTDAGPDDIVVDVYGNVYTANSRANTVTKVTASGKASTLGTTGKKPRGIAVDSVGNVYTSNLGDNT